MDVNRNERILLVLKKIEEKVSGRIELVAGIELLNIILLLIKISPSFSLDDGFETASCRQTEHSFEISRSFLEIKSQDSIVYLEPHV